MIVALHSVLREGREVDYDNEHRAVWPELVDVLRSAGIDDWQIWRSGRHLFHVVHTDDFAAAMGRLAIDPVNQRWQDHINTIVDHFEEGPEGMPLRLVWTLAGQAAGGPSAQ